MNRRLTTAFLILHLLPAVTRAEENLSAATSVPVLEDSAMKKYYPTGELMSEMNYFRGKLDGPSQDYYKNGQVMYAWSYRNDKLNGVSRAYYMNGKVMTVWKYKKGKLNDVTKQFYPTGKKRLVETYKAGQRIRRKAYNEKGKLLPVPPPS
jgi:antitoxin component YwqK of YwqJK toxin-antitoxin module